MVEKVRILVPGGSIPVEGIVYKSIRVQFFSLTYTFRTQSELVPECKVFLPV